MDQAVATHLDKLYEGFAHPEQYLLSLTRPQLTYSKLLRPDKYRQQFDTTQQRLQDLAKKNGSQAFTQAVETLQNTQLDQRYLTMALNLLIQV